MQDPVRRAGSQTPADVPWYYPVKALGYAFDLDPHIAPWQRGFWIDRIDADRINVGLGLAILSLRREYSTLPVPAHKREASP